MFSPRSQTQLTPQFFVKTVQIVLYISNLHTLLRPTLLTDTGYLGLSLTSPFTITQAEATGSTAFKGPSSRCLEDLRLTSRCTPLCVRYLPLIFWPVDRS